MANSRFEIDQFIINDNDNNNDNDNINDQWKMTNGDQWQRRCARGREGKVLHQEAGKKTDQLRWSNDLWLFDVKSCFKSCCVFIICKFQTAVEFGSSRVQRKQGPHLPDHQSSRVLNVTLITIAWFLPQAYLTKSHTFLVLGMAANALMLSSKVN